MKKIKFLESRKLLFWYLKNIPQRHYFTTIINTFKLLWQKKFYLSGGKFEPQLIDNAYKVAMRLNIKSVSAADFGSYKCTAKNSLGKLFWSVKNQKILQQKIMLTGDTDGTIKLYSKFRFNLFYYITERF